jgi:antitoxin ParD1/3/4
MISAEIPTEFEPFIQYQLATGGYHSAQEVVSDALRLLRQQKLETLREEIQVGVDDLERGDEIIIEDEHGLKRFFDELEAEARAELDAERSK